MRQLAHALLALVKAQLWLWQMHLQRTMSYRGSHRARPAPNHRGCQGTCALCVIVCRHTGAACDLSLGTACADLSRHAALSSLGMGKFSTEFRSEVFGPCLALLFNGARMDIIDCSATILA